MSDTIKVHVELPANCNIGAAAEPHPLLVGLAPATDGDGNLGPIPSDPPSRDQNSAPVPPYEAVVPVTPDATPNTGNCQLPHTFSGTPPDSLYVVFPSPYTNNDGLEFTLPLGRAVLCQANADNETITVNVSYELAESEVSGTIQREDITALQDDIYPPFTGVPVNLLDADQVQIDQTNTDAQGKYHFSTGIGDMFTLRFPSEMPFGDSLLTLTLNEITIQTEPGQPIVLPTLRYEIAHAQLMGQVTRGKLPLDSFTVILLDPGSGLPVDKDSGLPTDPELVHNGVTDAAGFYQYKNLFPGTYLLTFPDPYVDPTTNEISNLGSGQSSAQSITLAAGEVKMADPVSYQPEEHKIVWTVTSSGKPEPGKLVEILAQDNAGQWTQLVAQGRSGADGRVVFLLDEPGDYEVKVYSDDRIPGGTFMYQVSVHSTVTGGSDVAPSPGQTPNGSGGGAMVNGELKEAVVDSQAYPILTEAVSAPSAPGPAISAPSAAPGAAPLGQIVESALRDVLGWRPKASDPKAFLSALSQSFELKNVEGHVESKWTPRSYAVTVADDLGAVTGAQASIYNRAKVALDQSLPLLDGLYPLTTEFTREDIDAIRAIVRSEFTQLVIELGVVGGPRVQRVDELFDFLLGPAPVSNPTLIPDPEDVEGHLSILGERLSMERPFINTVEDEQNYTNYLIINDYVIGLKSSWNSVRKYFDHTGAAEPFLGTQLVLVSQGLTAAAEAVQQVTFAMDSVFLGPAERQTIRLQFNDGGTITVPRVTGDDDINLDGTFTFRNAPPLLVSELLDWAYRVATDEAPRMIQDSGKDGVIAIFPVVNKLRKLVQGALTQSSGGVQNPVAQALPAGYSTPRVQRALAELADELDDVAELAGQIFARERQPRANLEAQEVIDALRDPDVIQAIKTIAAQKGAGRSGPPRSSGQGLRPQPPGTGGGFASPVNELAKSQTRSPAPSANQIARTQTTTKRGISKK